MDRAVESEVQEAALALQAVIAEGWPQETCVLTLTLDPATLGDLPVRELLDFSIMTDLVRSLRVDQMERGGREIKLGTGARPSKSSEKRRRDFGGFGMRIVMVTISAENISLTLGCLSHGESLVDDDNIGQRVCSTKDKRQSG